MAETVSVIVPVYNREAYLAQTLDAIFGQRYPVAEVIIVDDGSTDNSAAVAHRYPVRYIKIANGGPGAARAFGVAQSQSRWIAFCDSDDVWRETHLESFFASCPPACRYGFANFVDIIDDDWTETDKFSAAPAGFFEDRAEPLYTRLLTFQPIWPSATIISRDYFEEVGGIDRQFSREIAEDFEFTLRCNLQGGAHIVFSPQLGVRKHSGNYSRGRLRQLLCELTLLEWGRHHHRLRPENIPAVEEALAHRYQDALAEAFVCGELDKVRALAGKIPTSARDLKDWVRIILAASRCVPGGTVRRLVGRRI